MPFVRATRSRLAAATARRRHRRHRASVSRCADGRHAARADAVDLSAADVDRSARRGRSDRRNRRSRGARTRARRRRSQARGPWSAFEIIELDSGHEDTEDTEDSLRRHAALIVPPCPLCPQPVAMLLARAFSASDPAERLRCAARPSRSLRNRRSRSLALASACRENRDGAAARDALDRAASLAPEWEAVAYESGKLWLVVRRHGAGARRISARRRSDADLLRRVQQPRRDARRARRTGGGARSLPPGARARSAQLHHSQQHRRRLPRARTSRRVGGGASPGRSQSTRRSSSATTTSGHTLFLAGRLRDALAAYEEGQRRDPQQNRRQGCRLAVVRLRQRRRRRRRARSLALRERRAGR